MRAEKEVPTKNTHTAIHDLFFMVPDIYATSTNIIVTVTYLCLYYLFEEGLLTNESVLGYSSCSFQCFNTLPEAVAYMKKAGVSDIIIHTSTAMITLKDYHPKSQHPPAQQPSFQQDSIFNPHCPTCTEPADKNPLTCPTCNVNVHYKCSYYLLLYQV